MRASAGRGPAISPFSPPFELDCLWYADWADRCRTEAETAEERKDAFVKSVSRFSWALGYPRRPAGSAQSAHQIHPTVAGEAGPPLAVDGSYGLAALNLVRAVSPEATMIVTLLGENRTAPRTDT